MMKKDAYIMQFSNKLLVIAISLIFSLLFFYLLIVNPLIAAGAFFLLLLGFICIKIKIEHFVLFFILVYPVLPFHAGIDLGYFLPVVKLHRLLVLLLIVCWVSKKNIFVFFRSFFKFPLTKLLWVMMPVYFISFVLRLNFRGFIFSVGTFFLESFMVAFIFCDVFENKSIIEIKRVYLFIAFSILIPVILGMIEYFTGFNPFSYIHPYREVLASVVDVQERLGISRIKTAFPHSIVYGLFFAMAVPAGLFYLTLKERETNNKKYLFWMICFLLLCFLGSYISLSRLALLAFLINALLLLGFLNVARALIFSIFAVITFTQPFFLPEMRGKIILLIKGILNYGYSSVEMQSSSYARIEQMAAYRDSIANSPFFGSGGSFKIGIIDNFYLGIVLETGFLGLAAYLSFFILSAICAFSIFTRSKNRFYKDVSFCTLTLIFVTFIVFSVLSITEYLYLIWIYIGIFWAVRNLYKKDINSEC